MYIKKFIYILKKSKSSLFFFGLLVFFFTFKLCYANFLSIKNDNLFCIENNCKINLKKNQEIKLNSKDNRIFELIEENYGKKKLINYLFYTTDINNTGAYSGKPLEILISLNRNGIIQNLKLIKHSEPILLTGIPVEKLLEAICFYKNQNINKKKNIGEDLTGEISVPVIAGATVTSLILHETILDTSREVAKICFGKVDDFIEGGLNLNYKKINWEELNKINAIKNYKLDSKFNENDRADNNDLLLDIFFADLKHPSIGKNLLGEVGYEELLNDIKDDESAIIILNNGTLSFKGSGFVRGGIFDRFRIEQNSNVFTFRDYNLKNVYDLEIIDIDDFRESGIFLINNKKYKAWEEWNLVFLINYNTFYVKYKIPEIFCKKLDKKWIKIWKSQKLNILMLIILWSIVIITFSIKDILSKNKILISAIYNFVLIQDIYIIGFLFEGQPSIVNIFAFIDNLKKSLEIFILSPAIFISWIIMLFTVFVWGKAIFCGWICPFGALQELIFKIKNLFFINKLNVDFSEKFRNKIIYIKYIILIVLIVVSVRNIELAEKLAEIEPFKTAWILGISNRPIYYSSYTVILLLISFFTYRFFCRYICPLGAFLSILSIFTIIKIKRRGTCSVCKICKNKCSSYAINEKGIIDTKECYGCFTCINNMYDSKICPPIKNLNIRKKYETNWW